MNILAIGDIVGDGGCDFLRKNLPPFKKVKGIDFVIANGENSAEGNGITPTSAESLFVSGVDVITTGNHAFRRKEIYPSLEKDERLLRPANYPKSVPGKGWCIVDMGYTSIAVINLCGTAFLENLDNPFIQIESILEEIGDRAKIIILDFHAEATAEKEAMGYHIDGRITAMFGTHTHVQTADECILPKGTGYITDVGMTGAIHSVLGVKPDLAISRFLTKLPVRFENATGPIRMNGIVFNIDEKGCFVTKVERISVE